MTVTMPIASVNVGRVAPLGNRLGHDVSSGIRKTPVIFDWLYLSPLGLEGDEQDDRQIHGGPLKAVYFYPSAHYTMWCAERNEALGPGMFGENVTVDDRLEADVRIGEVWRWGDALLQVTGHRRPCYKLDMLRGPGTAKAMMGNGRCGWYCSVLEPGEVPTHGALELESRPAGGMTILDSFRAKVKREPIVPDLPGLDD